MRVVHFGFPLRGHTTPSLPIVAELVRRGVEVDYHSTPAFKGLVEGAGARFVAYPAGCERLTAPVDSAEHLAGILTAAENMLPPLLAALEPRPDLVLFDASALWGGILARRLGLPCVASITTFALNRTMLQMLGAPPPAAWSRPAFKRLNDEYGANFRDHLDVVVPVADLKFVYTARAFQPTGRFFDESHLFLGPLVDRRPRDGACAQAAGARPLAYVSLGTIFNRDHGLLLRISEVLAARGWQVIVSLGDAAAAQQQRWPEHVQVHAFVDQIGVLAQAQLFVTHGGMNSVSEALSHAVPMIVIPQAVDQHLVARQTANLGAAVVIERDAVSIESLTAALARIEGDRAAFDTAAARLQRSFTEVTAVADAVDQALALRHRAPHHG
ncbi:glycosyltransferase [Phenylobacterium sp. LjRoot219]|uniref:macrolide family glycosyltransferase n=1 Tax=Phenylobacterium sp. LjRoot219 TaxID=3342283 RepID=UPI003ECCE9B0